MMITEKPRLMVLSQVYPFPGSAGQQQRVRNKLEALRKLFHVTFVAPVDGGREEEVRDKLMSFCDEAVLVPSIYSHGLLRNAWHKAAGLLYTWRTGLKMSNYIVGEVEFSRDRIASLLRETEADCALFEYWHAVGSLPAFHEKGIMCVLDMHDVLWQSYARQLDARGWLPAWWKRRAVRLYREQEERAWTYFDGLITINAAEHDYVRERMGEDVALFYAPMGVDTEQWPLSYDPADPPRIAYYGGLGSKHNQEDALRCHSEVMPWIWRERPDAEFWVVGGNPPASILALADDPLVKVTGFVKDVQDVLKRLSVVVCPWSGTYGFRSRLIEVMSLGVPVVASADAVYGMGLEDGRGLFVADKSEEMARAALELINKPHFARRHSLLAREQVEEQYGFEVTYTRMANEIHDYVTSRKADVRGYVCAV